MRFVLFFSQRSYMPPGSSSSRSVFPARGESLYYIISGWHYHQRRKRRMIQAELCCQRKRHSVIGFLGSRNRIFFHFYVASTARSELMIVFHLNQTQSSGFVPTFHTMVVVGKNNRQSGLSILFYPEFYCSFSIASTLSCHVHKRLPHAFLGCYQMASMISCLVAPFRNA